MNTLYRSEMMIPAKTRWPSFLRNINLSRRTHVDLFSKIFDAVSLYPTVRKADKKAVQEACQQSPSVGMVLFGGRTGGYQLVVNLQTGKHMHRKLAEDKCGLVESSTYGIFLNLLLHTATYCPPGSS